MIKKREIGVDLTSLLDVILIILFMFVINQSSQVATNIANESAEELQAQTQEGELTELEEKIMITKSELEELQKSYNDVKMDVASSTILLNVSASTSIKVVPETVEENGNKTYKLKLQVAQENEETTEEYVVEANNEESKDEFIKQLTSYYKELGDDNQVIMIVITYDTRAMKMSQYNCMESILDELQIGLSGQYGIYIYRYDLAREETSLNEVPEEGEQESEDSSVQETASPQNGETPEATEDSSTLENSATSDVSTGDNDTTSEQDTTEESNTTNEVSGTDDVF